MSNLVLNVSDSDFEQTIQQSETPILVDFWAEWCSPCRAIAPVLAELAKEYEGKLKIAKVNIDENPETPAKFAVRGIPTLMLFKNGELAETKVGAMTKSQMAAFIESHF